MKSRTTMTAGAWASNTASAVGVAVPGRAWRLRWTWAAALAAAEAAPLRKAPFMAFTRARRTYAPLLTPFLHRGYGCKNG